VIAAGGDADLLPDHLVDQPMLIGDPARPVAREVMFEGFRPADTFVSVSRDVGKQGVDALENLPVLHLPPLIVLPRVLVPDEQHPQSMSMSSWVSPRPASKRSMASRRRRALEGDRIKYAVSRKDS
jgi:hypothetical protein